MECIIGCILFGVGIVGSVLVNKTMWLHEYAPAVREEFLRLHPECMKHPQKTNGIGLIFAKIIVCLLFIILLSIPVCSEEIE